MATVTTNILSDGPTKAIIQVVIEGDNAGELSLYQVINPSLLTPPSTNLTIQQMWASTVWFDVAIVFNAVAPTIAWTHARDAHNYYDFRYFGGLRDQSVEDPDGKVLFTTNGLENGSVGVLILELKKN